MLWQEDDIVFCRIRRHVIGDDQNASSTALAAIANPTSSSINRLTHEYDLKEHLDSSWAIQPLELSQEQGHTILLLEDPGGELLSQLLGGPMAIERFLPLIISIAASVGKLHQQGLVHKDIKPTHIVVNNRDGAARLTGFGIASRVLREWQPPGPPEFIAGTLAYMAPEQTGRMNRSTTRAAISTRSASRSIRC